MIRNTKFKLKNHKISPHTLVEQVKEQVEERGGVKMTKIC